MTPKRQKTKRPKPARAGIAADVPLEIPEARRDAKVKNFDREQRKQVIAWFSEGGPRLARRNIKKEFGVSLTRDQSIYEAIAFWRSQHGFASASALAQERMRLEETARGAMSADERAEAITRHIEDALLEREDFEGLLEFRKLAQKKREAEQGDKAERQKLRQRERELEQKESALKLMEQRFQRETCELFLKWSASEKARKIVASKASNAEKIEVLGKEMFGEAWNA